MDQPDGGKDLVCLLTKIVLFFLVSSSRGEPGRRFPGHLRVVPRSFPSRAAMVCDYNPNAIPLTGTLRSTKRAADSSQNEF